jgi:hypothetical protein
MRERPSYGDILGRPTDQPDRDEIRADSDWTPVRLPGGGWRHWVHGQQVDTDSPEPPRTITATE